MPKRTKYRELDVLKDFREKEEEYVPSSEFPDIERSWSQLTDRQKRFLLLMHKYQTKMDYCRGILGTKEAAEREYRYLTQGISEIMERKPNYFRIAYDARVATTRCDEYIRQLFAYDIGMKALGGDKEARAQMKELSDTTKYLDNLGAKLVKENKGQVMKRASGITPDAITNMADWYAEQEASNA